MKGFISFLHTKAGKKGLGVSAEGHFLSHGPSQSMPVSPQFLKPSKQKIEGSSHDGTPTAYMNVETNISRIIT